VPARGQRGAVQQHPVELEQLAAAPAADRVDHLGRLGEVLGLVRNTGHRLVSWFASPAPIAARARNVSKSSGRQCAGTAIRPEVGRWRRGTMVYAGGPLPRPLARMPARPT